MQAGLNSDAKLVSQGLEQVIANADKNREGRGGIKGTLSYRWRFDIGDYWKLDAELRNVIDLDIDASSVPYALVLRWWKLGKEEIIVVQLIPERN